METLPIPTELMQGETEWIEYKLNNDNPDEIGQNISALANSACLLKKPFAYIIWGIDDSTLNIIGTDINLKKRKANGQELESWLIFQLESMVDFSFHELVLEGKRIAFIKIQSARSVPIRFKDVAFIRVGTYTKKLHAFPEKERILWSMLEDSNFEETHAIDGLTEDRILAEIEYDTLFRLLDSQLPTSRNSIINKLLSEKLISRISDKYSITNLGAILFAKDLNNFGKLQRKTLRIIVYKSNDRTSTIKEHSYRGGYANIFEEALLYIKDQLPRNEQIGEALRTETYVYPSLAIRELLANTLIHQDFSQKGCGPLVEIFSNRIEFSNPGKPLIDPLRFIDEPPRSRNEKLGYLMRRMKICEERGSGIDKVVFQVELFQLPPPDFRTTELSTVAVIFQSSEFNKMAKNEKIRACYQHSCLKWVSGEQTTNTSIRKRFGIKEKNHAMASRIIKDTLLEGLIKPHDTNANKKLAKYVPFWA